MQKRAVSFREFILRYPSPSLSTSEEEALRHEREKYPHESPTLPCAGMDCTDGEFNTLEVQGQGGAQVRPETEAAKAVPLRPVSSPLDDWWYTPGTTKEIEC